MCGRVNVIDNPLMQIVMDILDVSFVTVTNMDLRPTQEVATVALINDEIQQVNLKWGIKPNWSKKLLINAQAETAAEKRTFKKAFATQRCVVPCSGWYEWRDEGGRNKQRYLFEHARSEPLFMAGIWYAEEESNKLVTLTITPNKKCSEYHHRMPLLIPSDSINTWLNAGVEDIQSLISAPDNDTIRVVVAG